MDSTRGKLPYYSQITKVNNSLKILYIPIIFQRPYTTRSTPQPVMCGALGVSCMRFGVSDTSHLKAAIILRYNDTISSVVITKALQIPKLQLSPCYQKCTISISIIKQVIKMIDRGYRLPPPPGLTKELYKIMIQCWYVQNFPAV